MRTGLAKSIVLFVSLVLVFSFAPRASAQVIRGEGLLDHGPVDTGPLGVFPAWFMDKSGLGLEMCLDGPPLCISTPDDLDPVAGAGEAFYWSAGADLGRRPPATGGLVEIALEAAFLNPRVTQANAMVFNRLRVRLHNLPVLGRYTIVHPFGQTVLPAALNQGEIEINSTVDLPGSSGLVSFRGVLRAPNIGPFLRQTNAPPGFLGRPTIADTVIGGPNGNRVAVLRPDGTTLMQTTRFTVEGKIATNGGLSNARATYSRNRDGTGAVNATASSIGLQRIVARFGTTSGRLAPVPGQIGDYASSIPFLAAAVFSPTTITNLTDASRPSEIIDPVPDLVTITSATYDGTTLEVRANSSDLLPPADGGPRLRVFNGAQLLGAMNRLGVFTLNTPVAPQRVTVQSSNGGRDTSRVTNIAP